MQEPKSIEVESDALLTCPHCSKKLVDKDNNGVVPCGHVLFFYVSLGGFEYIDSNLEERMHEAEQEADHKEEFFDRWGFLRDESGAEIILKQTEGGIACGLVSCTVWVGIVQTPRS
jgi:ribosomal protein L37AE/L43A